ncbi:poly(glycerol-phosphate) alpha-glucosyltransferase [Virgibacillus subterraneus]|uniref:Poly(Glycerol-phosphate) alpha-glucosyltransferase n=1 Tax=Virgibacillus subterraneus TaxID=621109 RepID=A0A1H9AFL3_9BACI|nr:glycosyltransferase [Virgibacillus subterraneus]SEP75311.1 poly(glycerol-phosphate) alpha-glucosyltransferase [Virgibacillus subterraneus]
MKPTMFFLMNSIEIDRGGLTKASLTQASLFAEMGYKVYMVTFNFNPKYPLIRKKLVEMGKLHKNVIVLNMFEELEGNKNPIKANKPAHKLSLKKLAKNYTLHKKKGHNIYRAYDNGMYVKYYSLRKNGSLDFIDFFNENRYRTKREQYDPWGNLRKIEFMDFQLNKPRQVLYYDLKGRVYFSQWNDPESNKVQRIQTFKKTGDIKNVYINDNISHKKEWLKSIINKHGSSPSVMISDTRSTDAVLAAFHHPQVAKMWRLHSSHCNTQDVMNDEIAGKVKTGIDNLHKYDVALFLTEEQKEDVIKRLGNKTSYYVLPNYYEPKKTSNFNAVSSEKKDLKLAVIVSRLSTLKRIDHSIKAFRTVVDNIPDAKLEIWGSGDQEEKLKKLIKDSDLEKNVFLKGFTHDPDKVYRRGLFSTSTSKREGFPFSILESMVNGTPVISYDIKYGPNDMIEPSENGFIIENNNIDFLADKMLYMFENPDIAIQMGEKANKYIEKHFSKDAYTHKWIEAIDLAIKQKSKG